MRATEEVGHEHQRGAVLSGKLRGTIRDGATRGGGRRAVLPGKPRDAPRRRAWASGRTAMCCAPDRTYAHGYNTSRIRFPTQWRIQDPEQAGEGDKALGAKD